MTKTFESGSHVAAAATSPPPPPGDGKPPARGRAVYSAVCTTSTSACAAAPADSHTNSLAEENSVTNLDELELRALLDEAINYKTPKDREGKSKLFNKLLNHAEDDLREEHAHNASGPARHFSSTAKKRHRQRRQPSSVSENLTHGGSLNDLAKQELYEYESAKATRPKTVSTRQREGGSLPCNVNAGAPHVDKAYFMEERARQQEQRSMRAADAGDAAAADLLPPSFVSQTTIPIKASVDDALSFTHLAPTAAAAAAENRERAGAFKSGRVATEQFAALFSNSKKLDENDNSLAQSAAATAGGAVGASAACVKRKSKQKKASESVITAEAIKGHRGDIIENIDELVNFIEGTDDKKKKLHKQHSHTLGAAGEDRGRSKRTRKKSATMMHKSNSMEEISTTKLEDFACGFEALDAKDAKAPLRPTKSSAERRARLHKTWVVSSEQLQTPAAAAAASSASAENVEVADFIYVTKKKKSKKRRNSLGSRGNAPKASGQRPAEFHSLRASSPPRKSASSAPHSEKSADSSDNESLHSLPLDGDNKAHQISYADIAKSSERPKWNRLPSERRKNDKASAPPAAPEEKPVEAPATPAPVAPVLPAPAAAAAAVVSIPHATAASQTNQNSHEARPAPDNERETDTDLSSLQNWPEIRNNKVNQAKTNMSAANDVAQAAPVQDWPSIISNGAKPPPVAAAAAAAKHPVAQAKQTDNKLKKASGAKAAHELPPPPQSPANATEHLQQVLQVQTNSSNEFAHRHNNHEQQDDVANNPQQVIQQVSEQSHLYQMPPNIRDVQSIEEMQMRSLQARMSPALPDDDGAAAAATTAEKHRPAVVILSSGGDRHATSDITFGFGINEQLLSGDACADFVSRFLQPDVSGLPAAHVDQLVNYIGTGWEDILMQTHTGKVKYYTDELS